jgi:hypothetical protein
VLGSVLPDIDLKDSRPSRAMFAGLAVFFSFAVLFSVERKYSIAEMLILWMGTLIAVRYVGKALFFHFSYHRGVWHSFLATALCAFFTAVIYSKLLGRNDGVSWLAAGFMAIGYLTHLTLDEIYSVDVMDTRIKASFGTALKPFDFKHPGQSASMAVATVLVFLMTPPTKMFFDSFTSRGLWTGLQQRMLPQDKWFGVDWRSMAWMPSLPLGSKPAEAPAAPSPAAANPISTGSIVPSPVESVPQIKSEPPAEALPEPK